MSHHRVTQTPAAHIAGWDLYGAAEDIRRAAMARGQDAQTWDTDDHLTREQRARLESLADEAERLARELLGEPVPTLSQPSEPSEGERRDV